MEVHVGSYISDEIGLGSVLELKQYDVGDRHRGFGG
jgi:hypothetical protein